MNEHSFKMCVFFYIVLKILLNFLMLCDLIFVLNCLGNEFQVFTFKSGCIFVVLFKYYFTAEFFQSFSVVIAFEEIEMQKNVNYTTNESLLLRKFLIFQHPRKY